MFHRNTIKTEQIVALYESGNSSVRISKALGITKRLVLLRLKESGTVRRSLSKALRRYNLNEGFFETVDNESKAYWLGFLLADGNIGKHGRNSKTRQLRVTVQRNDKIHLSKLAKDLSSEHPIKDVIKRVDKKPYPASSLRITSLRLCTDLENLGWYDFKDKGCVDILNGVPDNLKQHLVRGLVDGDGWIFHSDRWVIGYCDLHRSIVTWVRNYLNCGGHVSERKNKKYTRVVYTGSRQILRIANHLYGDSTVHLNRKHALAKEVLLRQPKPS